MAWAPSPSGRRCEPVLAALGGRSAWLSIPHENRLQSPSRGLTQEPFICNAGRPLGPSSAGGRKPPPRSIRVVMFAWLLRRSDRRRNARELYGSIVTQARLPAFYTAWGVPDTVEGRFEMLLVHLSLVLDRLRQEGGEGGTLARAVSEAFIADMDANMREMTFGDLAVPREIKPAAAALFDRHGGNREGLAGLPPTLLLAALESQLAYLAGAGGLDAGRIAHYMLEAADGIGGQSGRALLAGRLGWPVPTP